MEAINKVHPWRIAKGYAASHCMQCKLGWTRTGKEGGVLIVCLLDREPVLDGIMNCNKFEPELRGTPEPA